MFALAAFYLGVSLLFSLGGLTLGGIRAAQRGGEEGYRLLVAGGFGLIVTLAVLALWVGLTVMVRKGHNWARIVATVLLVVGIASTLGQGWGSLSADPVVVPVYAVVELALLVPVAVLLWGPHQSRTYFASGPRAAVSEG